MHGAFFIGSRHDDGRAVLLFITGAGRYALDAMLLRKPQVRAAPVADCRIDWARRHRVKLTAITTKVVENPTRAGGRCDAGTWRQY
jgi:hypothetical protein